MKSVLRFSIALVACLTLAVFSSAPRADDKNADDKNAAPPSDKPAAAASENPTTPAAEKPAVPPSDKDQREADKPDQGKPPAKKVTGKEIYKNLCASCHGDNGQGVAEEHDEPLYGDRSLTDLTKIIDETMPFEEPELLSAEDSHTVAKYIYETFYTADARARNKPPRVELSRLTVRQYQQSVADLIGGFREQPKLDDRRGLPGGYYSSRNFARDKKAFDRDDARIEFDYGENSPDAEMPAEEFSVRWQGSLIVDESGDYQFSVKTQNGFRLWVNNNETALIDGWVSSGGEPSEHIATIRLLAGRAYPLKLDFFKYKDKSASIALRWKPPQKSWETIPERYLSPARVPESLVVSTPFPPDDSSTGYPRGTSVSKDWDKATTDAAVEAANYVAANLDDLLGIPRRDIRRNVGDGDGKRNGARRNFEKISPEERKERAIKLCTRLAERAFRGPLSDEQKQFFVKARFDAVPDVETAVKRAVLLALKSPRFLYPDTGVAAAPDYAVATRLALALWDSLPDETLLAAAAEGRLNTPQQINEQADRMLASPLAKAKVREFFHSWLPFEEAEDLLKDPAAYPGFDAALVSDLRTSLEMFIDDVVWSDASDYRQLLLADYWFVNERLAKFYGLEPPPDGVFHKVAVEPAQRAGVLTHPYLLSALAYHTSSSPIHRGVFITRKLLGRTLRPPPMAIQFMDADFDPHMTMREKVTELTKSQNCQACHSMINPLGFSLENFDAVGRFRASEKDKPIDSTGEYTTLTGEVVRLAGARDLAQHAAGSEEAHRGFVEQLFRYVVKQPAAAYGPETPDQLNRSFSESGYNIRKLLVEISKVAVLPPTGSTPGTPTDQQPSSAAANP